MELNFFGRGAGFNPGEGNTNAWMELNKTLVMLDCGESTFAAVSRHPGLAQWDHVVVLLTHLHADHAGSLASLCSYNYFVLQRKVLVVHPIDTVKELLRLQGVGEEVYDYAPSLPESYGIKAKSLPVRHVSDMSCFAYELSDGKETIYYSGDAADFPDEVAQKLQNGDYQRVYHDIASYDSATHCPVATVENKVPFDLRKRVYAMHLDSDIEQAFLSKGFSVVQANHI